MADYTMQDKIEELEKRKSEALQAGPERAIERQHEKGKLLARERIDYLLDEGSFHGIRHVSSPPSTRSRFRNTTIY